MAKSRTLIVRRMAFGTFLKWNVLSGIALGILFGIGAMVMAACGGSVTARLGSFQTQGMEAALLGLMLAPLLFGLVFLMLGLLTFLPFRLLLRLFGGRVVARDAQEFPLSRPRFSLTIAHAVA